MVWITHALREALDLPQPATLAPPSAEEVASYSPEEISPPYPKAASPLAPEAVVIVTHPTDVIDCEDHVVSFKVVISGGTDPITYTWQRMRPAEPDFSDIPTGAPNISYPAPGTLRIDNVGGFENPGGSRYRVVITDPSGSITSNDALLTVNEITDILPSIALPSKTNVILCEGTGFSYTVTTSGMPPVAYQWKKYLGPGVWSDLSDNAVISGAQSPVLTFTHPTPAESGQYKVHLTFHASGADCNVSSDSRIRVVTFLPAPVAPVIADPGSACLGLPPPLLVASPASGGSGSFLYQWQESPDGLTWSDIPGASNLTYQPPVLTSATWFRVKATDNGPVSCGNPTSAPLLIPVTDCQALHYRTIASGAWHNPTIWETSADGFTWGGTAWTYPTAAMRTITIREGHQVMVGQDLPVDQVTVEAGGGVTVLPGVVLTNTGTADDFTIRATSASAGSLIVPGSFSGKVTHQVQLRNPPEGGDYHYFSPPVSGETIAGFIAGNSCGMPAMSKVTGVWHWEEPLGDWQELTAFPGAVFTPGRGYNLAQNPGLFNDGLFSFRGWPVAGVTVAATSPYADMVGPTATRDVYDQRLRAPGRTASANWGAGGWNLLGNPYTSALRISDDLEGTEDLTWGDEFLEANRDAFDPNYMAVYLYDGTADAYRYIGHNTGGWDEPVAGAAIGAVPPGQGFFILAMNNSSVFSFTPEMQMHACTLPLKNAQISAYALSQESTAPPFMPHAKAAHKSAWIYPEKSSESAPNTSPQNAGQSPAWPGIRLFIRSGSREASTLVVFNDAMTEGLDPGFDIGLMSNGHDPEIFTTLVGDNGNSFARQALPLGEIGHDALPLTYQGSQVLSDKTKAVTALSHESENGTTLLYKHITGQYLSQANEDSPATPVIPVGVNSRSGGPVTFFAVIRLSENAPGKGTCGFLSANGRWAEGSKKRMESASIGSISEGSGMVNFAKSRSKSVKSTSSFTKNMGSGPETFFLEDRHTGVFTDMKTGEYHVDLPPHTQGTGRFFLHFSSNGHPPDGGLPLKVSLPGYSTLPSLPSPNAAPSPEIRIVPGRNELLIFGNLDLPAPYEIIDLSGKILDSGTIYPWTVALGTTATVEITSESNSHLPTVWGSPLHLPLPRHYRGLLLVRISTPKTNIVYKYLNYP